MIRIVSKRHNFRRCGMAHPQQTTDHPDDRFTDEELAILRAEPMLSMEVIPDPEPELEMEADPDAELIAAAKMVIDAGEVLGSGAPKVPAMVAILGRNITAGDRDRAWAKLKAGDGVIATSPPLEEMDETALKALLDKLGVNYSDDTPVEELRLLVERFTAEPPAEV